jgi:hypothetical protein
MNRTLRRIGRARIALVSVLCAAVVVPTVAGLASAGNEHSLAAVTKSATARYHDVGVAEADGYALFRDAAGIACIDNQPVGGMGVHYAKGSLVGDIELDPMRPEALVYAPNAAGELKLAALEYLVFAGPWDAAHAAPPSLFGTTFNFTPSPNRFGIPAYYSLHAWVWRPNSDGLLQPWNPRVRC